MKSLVKNKNYMLLFWGSLISFLGDTLQDIALMWYIYSSTHSPIMASISLIINFLPKIIFSPLAGIFTDKKNRKHIIVICDFLNGVCAITLGIMIYFNMHICILLIITFIMSTVDTFFAPASMSMIPQIVKKDKIIVANSLSTTMRNIINIAGPALAGILYVLINPMFLFIGNGVSFSISAVFELFIKYTYNEEKIKSTKKLKIKHKIVETFKEYMNGFKIIVNDKFLLFTSIIGGGIINFFLAPVSIYIPVYVSDVLKLSSVYFGIMNSAITIGSLIASSILIVLGKKCNKNMFVVLGFVMQGISLVLFGIFTSFVTSFISLIILGIALSITGINLNTIVQERIPNEILGRCMSAILLIANITVPTGYLVGGYVINYIQMNIVLIFSGIIVTICGLISVIIFKKKTYIQNDTLSQ